ncbi:aspartic proteinase CDR1-like [Bidens hawaiensis]|uniref:aspartic proteinase CDR1-like n=1 Tax=Bidens hawaiensis TaxID=980011 RepID=UPI00404B9B0A
MDVDISAEYTMKIGIGSPPVPMFVTVSTSTSLTWIPCEPYIPFKQVSFGYSHEIEDINDYSHQYLSHNVSGSIGLGDGPLSLVNQLKSVTLGKFSYCLMPHGSSQPSKIYFGELFNMSGPIVVSTSLMKTDDSHSYTVYLFDVLVGNKSVSSYNHNHNQPDYGTAVMNIDIDAEWTSLMWFDRFKQKEGSEIEIKEEVLRQFSECLIKTMKIPYKGYKETLPLLYYLLKWKNM